MKLCPNCNKTPWPFVMVLFLAGVSAFVTWLTLSYSQLEPVEQLGGSALAFLAIGGTLTHYVIGCIRRHCRHGRSTVPGQGHGSAH